MTEVVHGHFAGVALGSDHHAIRIRFRENAIHGAVSSAWKTDIGCC